jgi:prohibitin 2
MRMQGNDADKTKEAVQAIVRKVPAKVIVIAGVIVLISIFFRPWVQVGAGQRGIVLNFGAVQKVVLDEGLHLRIPVMQEIVLMDVKVQKAETDAAAASADLQDVTSRVALNYHVVPDKANIVYQNIGVQFKERIIDPAILEVVKAVTAKYTAEELITKRPAVSEAMRRNLMDRLLANNIAVDAFSIVTFKGLHRGNRIQTDSRTVGVKSQKGSR